MQLTSCSDDANAVEDDTIDVIQNCRADSKGGVYSKVEGQVTVFVCLVIVLEVEASQFVPLYQNTGNIPVTSSLTRRWS